MQVNRKTPMLEVLDYTKTDKKWFDDQHLYAGYHTVSIQGERVIGQRDPEKRIKKMKYDFSGKRILDVGCSNGGLLHELSEQILFGVGVDFNAKCINAANALKAVNETGNIHFYTFDLDKEDLSILKSLTLGESIDVCFFFNISLWVKRWKDVFLLCSSMAKTIFFEAHGNDEQQDEQLNFVRSIYQNVVLLSEKSDDDPTYAKRKMYICESKYDSGQEFDEKNIGFLSSAREEDIKTAYETAFAHCPVRHIDIFPSTHESIVAEVNHEYIVKLPRPKRGAAGLNSEKATTDYMRSKLALPIPSITIYSQPVLMGRYLKLPGRPFDKHVYHKLSGQQKDEIASQLANVFASFHSVSAQEIKNHSIPLSPSWSLSVELIEQNLYENVGERAINALVKEVISNHKLLEVPESNLVFGHFDIHGGNVLVNEKHDAVSAIIDFGNCKIGDIHQDISAMNLSSPELAQRVLDKYEVVTGRKLNRRLIQHYTTMFYLHLLAGLKSKQSEKYDYWAKEFESWYQYLLMSKAGEILNARQPVSTLPDGWKKWIASNLMKGAAREGVQKVLAEQGFSDLEVATEILRAENHPYIQAGSDINFQLKKRNWLLQTCDALARLDDSYSTQIDSVDAPEFNVFVKKYYSKHLPVLLKKGIDHWPAMKKWDLNYFMKEYGDKTVEVQFGREQDKLYERNAGKLKKKMLMSEYLELIKQGGESNNYYMTANNTKNSLSSIDALFDDLGDFHKGYRQEGKQLKQGTFFWLGPKGTFTPNHHDLTNNMLVQVMGRKQVTLIPAWQVQWLYNDKGVFSAAEFPDYDENKHPLMKNITPIEVVIEPGEALFIPIGWWHAVRSLDVSVSISFTNFNTHNQFSSDFPRDNR